VKSHNAGCFPHELHSPCIGISLYHYNSLEHKASQSVIVPENAGRPMERSIRFGSIKVSLTVGNGKERSIYEVKICGSDLTVATAAARTVSMYGGS
jgi:hypothetical protein